MVVRMTAAGASDSPDSSTIRMLHSPPYQKLNSTTAGEIKRKQDQNEFAILRALQKIHSSIHKLTLTSSIRYGDSCGISAENLSQLSVERSSSGKSSSKVRSDTPPSLVSHPACRGRVSRPPRRNTTAAAMSASEHQRTSSADYLRSNKGCQEGCQEGCEGREIRQRGKYRKG